jgi:uncharacterized protein DUF664
VTASAGRSRPRRKPEDIGPNVGGSDESWDLAENEKVSSLIREYEQTCEQSRQTAARFALEDSVPEPDLGQVSLRWIYVHMIEETARHAGHADILRELTDGTAGMDGDSAVTTWLDRIVVNAARLTRMCAEPPAAEDSSEISHPECRGIPGA